MQCVLLAPRHYRNLIAISKICPIDSLYNNNIPVCKGWSEIGWEYISRTGTNDEYPGGILAEFCLLKYRKLRDHNNNVHTHRFHG
jgi:hypothetical protein